jgi:hypothetical protein
MAVVDVKERHQERSVTETANTVEYTRVFWVETDDKNDGPFTVKNASFGGVTIPVINEEHPEDDRATVNNINAKPQDADQKHWLVAVTYTLTAGEGVSWGGNNVKPWEVPPKTSVSFAGYTETFDVGTKVVIDFDQSLEPGKLVRNPDGSYKISATTPDQPIVNSALMPFDPGVIGEKFNLVINIEEARQVINPAQMADYNNSLNDSPITVAGIDIAQYQGRLLVDWSNAYYGNKEYFNLRWNIEVNRDTFIKILHDAGLVERFVDGAGVVEYKPIKVKDKETGKLKDAIEPQQLDGLGRSANGLDDEGNPKSSNGFMFYQSFLINPVKDWSALNIPKSHKQDDKDKILPEKDDA